MRLKHLKTEKYFYYYNYIKYSILKHKLIFKISVCVLFAFLLFLIWPVNNDRIKGSSSLILLSKENTQLREFRDEITGGYSKWKPLKEFPDVLIKTVITAEDKRFFSHMGFDLFAASRAFYQNISNFKIISGGSTITQQLSKIIYSDILPENNFLRKIIEIFLAIRLDFQFDKNTILEAYLNRVPMRNNCLGLPMASERIFNKDIGFLSFEESAALSVLIRETQTSKQSFNTRFQRLMKKAGKSNSEYSNYLTDIERRIFNQNKRSYNDFSLGKKSPHFTEWFKIKYPYYKGYVRTEISENLNNTISKIIQNEMTILNLNEAGNAAVVVLEINDNPEMPLLLRSIIGSVNFSSAEGQVNGAVAVRTAGSSLKPFLYAMAIEENNLRPYSFVEDSESTISISAKGATYRPRNYDLNFWGKMTVREALATSRNIPVINLIQESSFVEFYEMLIRLNIGHMKQGPAFYGPSIALGTTGVSLLDLTRAYSVFPAGGLLHPVYIGKDESGSIIAYGTEKKIYDEKTSFFITHILSDNEIRKKAFGRQSFLDFPFETAAKTGTSKDYRDSWTVGYTSRYVIGVWVGNFSGESMKNISGVFGAGRIFQQIMRHLEKKQNHRFSYPEEWQKVSICRLSGKLAQRFCPVQTEFLPPLDDNLKLCLENHGDEDMSAQNRHGKLIISPVEGETYLLDPHSPEEFQRVPFEINSAPDGFSYSLNGQSHLPFDFTNKIPLKLEPGDHSITVYKNGTMVDHVDFNVR